MFLSTILRKEKYRFNYTRKMGTARLEKSQIKLPATPQGEPDWQFMENYIKSLPYTKNLKSVKMVGEDFQLPNSFEKLLTKAVQPFESNPKK